MLAERLGRWILSWPARWLVVEDAAPAGPIDLIFLVSGSVETRANAAAELFRSVAAGKIIKTKVGGAGISCESQHSI